MKKKIVQNDENLVGRYRAARSRFACPQERSELLMTVWTIAGIVLVLLLIIGVGLLSGRKVKNAGDFVSGGGKAGSLLVCGTIMGALVSSQATIGTAQLAFHYGLAAWWFTLGSGIGCLILGVGYTSALRRSGCITELQILSRAYGAAAGSLGSVLCSLGIFISVLAQIVACSGLVTTLFPQLSVPVAAAISVIVMCFYVLFGGAWGAGMGGVVKLILLYVSSVVGMVHVLVVSDGAAGLFSALRTVLCGTDLGLIQKTANGLSDLASAADLSARFQSLVARGAMKDIGSGVSLLLGVLSTQTYAQAIWSAETDRKAKRGALLSAALIPPLGIAGICIGLFMRSHYLLQAEVDALTAAGAAVPQLPVLASTIQVFPMFVLHHLPALVGGIVLGTLLITSVGGGAGLSLGMATILVKDIYQRVSKKACTEQKELSATRVTLLGVLLAAAIVAALVPGSTINDLGFLSMGLRGSVVLVPMSFALWVKGPVRRKCILASILLSPLAVLLGALLPLPFDALYLGIACSLACCILGRLLGETRAEG